ncbi:DUF4393 domain-containing protein [Mesorhizobium sp. M2D.F.Ca.ET.223.01.1.1]|uniref:Abi-alpha family protein n=1 Tax=Mesorhizobium sp. M2D.F.Ca.ET.223.01.1.1 TaxID=2563940 RepID=UPI001092F0EF|nr:Abi-alpha family protein [Mesorhizobium sp. M2D.F.Ca.ET.223.01.1.1]TGR83611.1 DUF4393 domain-containing protein [Mesorhizobium sp. M2D.F.Ca.ET.223.01.1.1]TGT74565.1 DUF4393 domain-containing protein [bacterium M00.F.Ca.ET.159.01.1.1]TGT86815.1 DUF4393 domain-containing protein [bacterium M00.F.Ca.ET.157.01.1.1]
MGFGDKQSEAIEQVAKTVGEFRPEIQQMGKFIAKVIGHPLEQTGGLIGDVFGIARMELFLKYEKRVRRIMAERKLDNNTRPLPLSMAYPLLAAASLEEDDELSEMLAQLLVNAMDTDFEGYVPKSFVETLRNMSPFEALILKRMVEAPPESVTGGGFMDTTGLPDKYHPRPGNEEIGKPPRHVSLALGSLETAGCVHVMASLDGHSLPGQANVTEYGRELIRACSAPLSAPVADRPQPSGSSA